MTYEIQASVREAQGTGAEPPPASAKAKIPWHSVR